MVGYDGSDCATAALDAAIQLSALTGRPDGDHLRLRARHYGAEHDAHPREVRKFGERATAPALERTRKAGVDASLALIPERPVDALLAIAEEHDARAIVIGARGEGRIRAAIVGSVPHKLFQVSERRCWLCRCARADAPAAPQ